ncbi:MAG TPA: hypothetical protein PL029_09685 [Bacteroidia bacterium]|nr:hypothetical protein [Bacteroidia bacterium]
MTNFKSLLLALALITGPVLSSHAFNNDKGPDFSARIRSALSTPKCFKNKNTHLKVTVYFVVNQNGEVIEANAKTNNAEVKAHLEKQFLGLNLKGLTPCVTNTVDVNFTTA